MFVLNVSSGAGDHAVRSPLDVVMTSFMHARNQRYELERRQAIDHVDVIDLPRPHDARELFDFSGARDLIDAAYELAVVRLDEYERELAAEREAAAATVAADEARVREQRRRFRLPTRRLITEDPHGATSVGARDASAWGVQGGRRVPIVVMVASLFAAPVFLGSCGAEQCASPAYEAFVGRLVEMHGTTATYLVESVVGGEYATSTAKVGRRRTVRYGAGDAALLRVGTSYRVELNGDGEVDSRMHRPCSVGTTFTDGSAVVTRTWWQRNHVALAIVVAIGAVVVGVATWLRRRRPARGGADRLRA